MRNMIIMIVTVSFSTSLLPLQSSLRVCVYVYMFVFVRARARLCVSVCVCVHIQGHHQRPSISSNQGRIMNRYLNSLGCQIMHDHDWRFKWYAATYRL